MVNDFARGTGAAGALAAGATALRRARRALEAAERIPRRGVAEMDKNILPIAMKVCECATFTAAALGMEDAMDACRRARALAGFLAKHDEDAAVISARVTLDASRCLERFAASRNFCHHESNEVDPSGVPRSDWLRLEGSPIEISASSYLRPPYPTAHDHEPWPPSMQPPRWRAPARPARSLLS